jgi:hypothetical protein
LPICKNDDHNIHQCPKNISKKQCWCKVEVLVNVV